MTHFGKLTSCDVTEGHHNSLSGQLDFSATLFVATAHQFFCQQLNLLTLGIVFRHANRLTVIAIGVCECVSAWVNERQLCSTLRYFEGARKALFKCSTNIIYHSTAAVAAALFH